MYLTGEQLKRAVVNIPDDARVGIVGFYGELIPFSEVPVLQNVRLSPDKSSKVVALVFERLDAGPEPA